MKFVRQITIKNTQYAHTHTHIHTYKHKYVVHRHIQADSVLLAGGRVVGLGGWLARHLVLVATTLVVFITVTLRV